MDTIKGNFDIIIISETKLDSTFKIGKFLLDGFNGSIRLDRNRNGGGILLLTREDIPTKVLPFETSPIEGLFIEISLYKKEWLLLCSHNPDSNTIKNHLSALSVSLEIYSSQYEHFIVLEDFNVEVENGNIDEFCKNYNFKKLIRVPTCYKNPNNLSGIDLTLTHSQRSFQSFCGIETGLSDFHRMTVTVMKSSFPKLM